MYVLDKHRGITNVKHVYIVVFKLFNTFSYRIIVTALFIIDHKCKIIHSIS